VYAIPSWVLIVAGLSSYVMGLGLIYRSINRLSALAHSWSTANSITKLPWITILLILLAIGIACTVAGVICVVVEGRYILPSS
jgi:hypothetical protein